VSAAPHDPERCATSLPELLEDAWSDLEHQRAVVRRVPLSSLSRGEVAVLLWHERRRLRVLMERHAPDPLPFDWRKYRRSLVYVGRAA
jgi:hypothetical protein